MSKVRETGQEAEARKPFWSLTKEPAEEPEEIPEDGETGGIPEPEDVIDIEGEIIAGEDWWGDRGACYAGDFRRALDGLGNVTVRINSPGGDVMAGAEIYSALREHSLNGRGKVRVKITALAASAASVIAMAGDEIMMYPTAYMMIHNPWTMAVGDAREMRKAAKTLDEIARGIINAYRIKTGKTEEQLKKMLEAETWMSAGTCVAEGFADGIIGGEIAAAAQVLMGAKSHGAQEIIDRYRAARKRGEETEDPEETEEPEEAEEPETDEPEETGEGGETDEPEEDDPEETGARGEEPEEDDPETGEEDDPEEDGDGGQDPETEGPDEDPDDEDDPEEDAEDLQRAEARAEMLQELMAARIMAAGES